METPKLLAIDDVYVAAPPAQATCVAEFYTTVVGLRLLEPRPEEPALVFSGYSRAKPRLVVQLGDEARARLRGYVQVQVASLVPIQQVAEERGLQTIRTQRLTFFDRRLTILDPAGNRVDILSYHML